MGKQTDVSLPADRRGEAMTRFAILRPHMEDGVPLVRAAEAAGVPVRTARRWLARFRQDGVAGLARKERADRGRRKLPDGLVRTVEGMALTRPPPSAAAIHKRLLEIAHEQEWPVPARRTVRAIIAALDPAMRTLAHDGPATYRDRYELVHRHRAARPNALWQCDHTELDILVVAPGRRLLRPWLTLVLDDYSRAIAGYSLLIDAPSAMNTALALRQAIWRKDDPDWQICGIPDVLYVDHGSDFTSIHIAQVAADLQMRLVYSTVARPQGRGKIERLFGSVNTELLASLPGRLLGGKPVTPPRLTLSELDAAVHAFVVKHYNSRSHPATGTSPNSAWVADGWLPRMPDRLEELDELLVLVARPRVVGRDGIRFGGLRYLDPTLAAFVGERVTIRHDPRDVAEIRVYHRDRFLCRAINAEHADRTVSLRDVQAARRARRKALRTGINQRIAAVPAVPDARANPDAISDPVSASGRRHPRLKVYRED
ncbi:Mu transposase C-terminal domain-containing protein [Salipiger marinus]|nr:Mu transposase C-terminal domain-containing protein [Salipiger marinus]